MNFKIVLVGFCILRWTVILVFSFKSLEGNLSHSDIGERCIFKNLFSLIQVDVPPRAFHCSFCGKCMLKRVHHCFLTGSCIGFYNHRHFVTFCLWSSIGSVYCMYLQLSFLNMDLPLNTTNFITYIPPVTLHQLIMGNITIGQACVVAHFFVCAPVFLVALFFFFWHLLFVFEGVTKYEAYHNQFAYKRSKLENINSVFGSLLYIPLLIIFPFKLPQSGDGIQWKQRVKGN